MSVRRPDHRTSRSRRMLRTVLGGLATIALAGASLVVTSPSASARTASDDAAAGGATVERRVLNELAADETTDFWVYFRREADLSAASGIANRAKQGRFVYDQLTEAANRGQAGVRAMLEAEGVEYEPFWIANTMRVTGDEDLLRRLAARPEVEQITADRTYRIPEPIPAAGGVSPASVEWGIDRIRAPQAWDQFGTRGEGIVVGSIDTGAMYTHPALIDQYRGNLGGGVFDHNYNWWDPSNVCGSPSLEPCDTDGHGTHTMGTMVGDDGGSNQIGVAPRAQWMTAKGCEGILCSQFALLSSGQFMLAPTDLQGNNPDPSKRPDVLNNSWGGPADADPWFQPTVQAWVAAGIFPQFSAGNSQGTAQCGSASNPGNLVESYAAGAIDIDNNLAPFSNRGPSAWGAGLVKPNISAPGVDVRSAWNDGSYNIISGTSMASPHVAGTVALMWSAAPAIERDVATTRTLLDQTAIDTPDLTCGGTPENNNMHGEGRLDAFAAVEQSPRGPMGTLSGLVSDAASGEPIAGARVTVSGEVDRDLNTGDDGSYSTRLPVGDYTVTAAAFGYIEQTAQVTVADGQTTVRDFVLEPAPSVTVAGTVTDGSGHGWPLYAKVRVPGTPRSTYTDPVTGRYRIELPAGSSHTIVVEPQYPGYAGISRPLEVGSGDVAQDFELTVDDCETAPGYTSARVGVLGDFGGGLFDFLDSHDITNDEFEWHIFADDDPADYDVIIVNDPSHPSREGFLEFLDETDAAGTGVVWLDNSVSSADSRPGIQLLQEHLGNPSSRSRGFGEEIPYLYYKVTQNHPVLDGFAVGDEIVFDATSDFKSHAWFDGYQGEGRTVIADAGRADTGDLGSGIGVQQRANNRHVLLSMHGSSGNFFGSGPQHWTPDAGQLFLNALEWATTDTSIECRPAPGGLVVGNVTDANTGAGLEPATVVDVDNASDGGTRTSSIEDDPAHGAGFFWRFSPQTGARTFRASAHNYADATTTIDVRPDAANEADLALPAGLLEMNPSALEAQLQIGQAPLQRSFTITNTGTAPATVGLTERRGGFEIMGVDRQTARVRNIEGHFKPDAMPSGERLSESPDQAAPSAAPWTTLPNYPQPILDNSATVVEDVVYSFGGTNGSDSLADAYAFDPAVGQWDPISSMPADRMKPEVVEHDGLIYILGGWSADERANDTVFVYDPGSDIYRELAPMPAARAASGAAVVDGKIYVVGGCSAFFGCTQTNTVWRYDSRTDSWDTLAAYPETVSWLSCAGLDGRLYCAGGSKPDFFDSSSASTFEYDPASDSWSRRADLPYDNWGMSYAAANGQLVVSGGVTNGSSEITNRGAAYDPTADRWTEIEPSSQTVFRAAGVCGFYKIGGLADTPTPNTEIHPDFRDCPVTSDLPWLSVTPQTVTLQPGEQVQATVRLDGSMDQPGTYAAGLGIRHDTPYGVDPLDVTVTVTPPNDWGKITGTVTGVDCQGNERPLPGSIVRIDHAQGGVTRFTDAAGRYAYWLATANNPVEVIVSSSGHVPQSRTVRITPRKTVVEDFALQQTCGA